MKPRIPPLLIVLAAALLMWLSSRLIPALALRAPAARPLAVALAALGALVAAIGVGSFRRARTTVNPLEPQQASTLVVRGVYRFSRNPMYLGFAVLLLAWAFWLSHPLALPGVALFILYMNRYQIEPEEHALDARFGAEYRGYKQRVRRWL